MDGTYQDDFQNGYNDDYYVDDDVMDPSYGVEPESTGTSAWVWVIIVVVVIIIIVGIILIIWWATGSNDEDDDTGPLAIVGSDFVAISSTSIGATWTRVGNDDDIVTLYVNPSGHEMKFDTSGKALGSYSTSGPVTSPGTTATVTNLVPDASYDAVLVVTNLGVDGNNHSHFESGINTSTALPPGAKFNISASAQPGHIHYNAPSPNQVSYSLQAAGTNDSLFMRDANGYICATTSSAQLTPQSTCADGSFVLYSSASTGTASLSIKQKSDLTPTELNDARWSYNTSGDNKWCLTNPGSTGRCMSYSVNSPVFIPLDPVDTVGPLVEDTTTNQQIFVINGGSKWTNTQLSTN